MLERFSDAARRAVVLAHQEAKQLGTDEISGEHILLGLAAVSEGVGAQALSSAGIGLEALRHHVEELADRARQPSEHVSFGEPTTRVFRFSEREAGQLGHDYVGTGHVLLGLIQDRERVAAQVLVRLHPDLEGLRRLVVDRVTASPEEESTAHRSSVTMTTRSMSTSTATTVHAAPDVRVLPEEAERLRGEVARLQALLRQHGIDPAGDDPLPAREPTGEE
jgi:ATP-dependent Clp protease ATP-binding subunit ClpA